MTVGRRGRPHCLDAETLAAFVDRRLDPTARDTVLAHVATCEDCSEALAEVARMLDDLPLSAATTPAVSPASTRPVWRWALAGTALAAVLALAVLTPRFLGGRLSLHSRPELSALVAAVGTSRPIEGRLTGGFAYGAAPPTLRSAATAAAVSPDTRIATAELQKALDRSRTPSTLAAYASGAIAEGDLDTAIRALQEATALDASSAARWSDLSAAFLARSREAAHGTDLLDAMEAAQKAVTLDPALAEAAFNRALAVERLSSRTQAIAAWQAYLAIDAASGWATEARQHLAALQAPKQAAAGAVDVQDERERMFDALLPAWSAAPTTDAWDAVLAAARSLDRASADRYARDVVSATDASHPSPALLRGFGEYGLARRVAHEGHYDEARPHFARASEAFAAAGNPMRELAAFNVASCDVQVREFPRAAGELTALAGAVPPSHPSVAGRVAWVRGNVDRYLNRLDRVDALYAQAFDALTAAGEPRNADFVTGLEASSLSAQGDERRAWDLRLHGLEGDRRYTALTSASFAAANMAWTAVAVAYAQEAVTVAGASTPRSTADALRSLALAHARAGDRAAGLRDLAAARALADPGDTPLVAEFDAAEAQIDDGPRAEAGLAAATRAIAYFGAQTVQNRLPLLLRTRARLLAATGKVDDARTDLEHGLTVLEAERKTVTGADRRATFGDEVRDLGDALADLELSCGRESAALAAIERVRAADLLAGSADSLARGSLDDLVQQLPPHVALAYFFVTPERLHVWGMRDGQRTHATTPISEIDLRRLVDAFLASPESAALAARLHDLTLQPIANTLRGATRVVVVPDGPLSLVPMSALRDRSGRFVVEDTPVLIAPSLTWLITATRRGAAFTHAPAAITAFGNPRIDADRFPTLPTLPGAEREATLAASAYASRDVLVGERADRAALLDALESREVVHFAGHTLINDVRPLASELVVWDAAHQPLTAADLAGLRAPRARLVVLSACSSARGLLTRGEGLLGLTRALLAAGIPTVVASQWAVSDAAAQALFADFHQIYAHTGDAIAALRHAQLALAHSPDPSLRSPAAWGAFEVVGGLPAAIPSPPAR